MNYVHRLRNVLIFVVVFFLILVGSFECKAYWGQPKHIKVDSFTIYKDYKHPENRSYPSGWGGDYEFIEFNDNYTADSYLGDSCIEIVYKPYDSPQHKFALIFWQNAPHAYDMSGAKSLTFYARGKRGDEIIEFALGVEGDSASIKNKFVLSKEWEKYTFDLEGNDLSDISALFGWIATLQDNPDGLVFYLDEIIVGD